MVKHGAVFASNVGRRVKGRIAVLEYRVARSALSLRCEILLARWDSALARRSTPGVGPGSRHVLIPTVGLGNIGDQAMLETWLDNVAGPVTLVLARPDSHRIPPQHTDRVEVVVAPGIVDMPWWRRRGVRRMWLRVLTSSRTVSVVGADVMDGGYDPLEAVLRFNALSIAGAAQRPTRVLGFSWNGRATPSVVSALRLTQPDTMLCLRDPHSYDRMAALRVGGMVQVADMVFRFDRMEPYHPISHWCERMADAGRRIVIVNASGLLVSSDALIEEFRNVVANIRKEGHAVLALPHVIRAGDDDLAACQAVVTGFDDDAVEIVVELLRPAQVAWLVSKAFSTLTGRMHLAIFSLSAGRPAAVLSSQGKVSGLMESFDLGDFVLEPAPDLGIKATEAIRRFADDPVITATVKARLPELKAMASGNFVGLS